MNTEAAYSFLKKLKKNNNKPWFDAHRPEFEIIRIEFEEFVQDLIFKLSLSEPSLTGLTPKECIFRLYRDIRFSKDKTPYKTHLSAFIAPGGRKTSKAGYYFHLEPGGSMLGGGIYMPPSEPLQMIRKAIDREPEEFVGIVTDRSFKKMFGELEGDQSKKIPKGFSADHPYGEWLKYKSYFAMYRLSDKEALSPRLSSIVIKISERMRPLCEFLNHAVS